VCPGHRLGTGSHGSGADRGYSVCSGVSRGFHPGVSAQLNDTLSIAVDAGGTVWVATSGGVCRIADGKLLSIDTQVINGPAFDVETDEKGVVWIGEWNGLYRLVDGHIQREAGLHVPVGIVTPIVDRLFVSTPKRLQEKKGESWEPIAGPWSTGCPEIAIAGDDMYVASPIGLFRKRGDEIDLLDQDDGMLSQNLHGIAVKTEGGVRVGSRAGVDMVRDGKHIVHWSLSRR